MTYAGSLIIHTRKRQKYFMRPLLSLLLSTFLFSCTHKGNKNWELLPFSKLDSLNPVLLPGTASQFTCPIRNTVVHWEEKDVFNPAAVVRHDTVFLLYRAEDSIGKYAGTSRIGLAYSADGLHFTKYPVPVLFPANDNEKR